MPVLSTCELAVAGGHLSEVGGPIVVVPVFDAVDDVRSCLASLLAHTDARRPILVVDDASTDPSLADTIAAVADGADHHVVVYRRPVNAGFVAACNDAFHICTGRDVVIVNSDVEVGAEWLERMVAAAHTSNTVATVSTLTNHGTIVSVPERNRPGAMPEGLSVDEASRRVAAAAKRSYPVLPTGIGHCLLVTSAAREVVGGFDEVFAPGYGEEVDFCLRAASVGFINVLADDVFVHHRGGSSFGTNESTRALQVAHEQIVNDRHPNYAASVGWAASAPRSPLAEVVARARRALVGTSVAIDGLCLGPILTGTQRTVLEVAIALTRYDSIDDVHLFVPEVVPGYVARAAAMHPRLVLRPRGAPDAERRVFDVVVRPYQLTSASQLQWMRSTAPVSVVMQLDLIAYHNPSYFRSAHEWRSYRKVTEAAFDAVDGFAFISEHSLREAEREGLLQRQHHRQVTYCGLDHESQPIVPERGTMEVEPGFLLVLGTSFAHKNRLYALELFGHLVARGFDRELVLAGPTPTNGNSQAEELAWLEAHPELALRVVQHEFVSEEERLWLLGQAGLVVYPTLTEGFGLVAFEAALAGSPTLTTRQAALDEVLPRGLATMPTLRPADSVTLAERLPGDPVFREQQVEILRAAASAFRWRDAAEGLIDLIDRSLDAPSQLERLDVALRALGGDVLSRKRELRR